MKNPYVCPKENDDCDYYKSGVCLHKNPIMDGVTGKCLSKKVKTE